MVTIRIDNTGDGTFWLYGEMEEWKNYIAENFDEKVVLYGNRYFNGRTEASWYKETEELLNILDCYDELPDELTEEQSMEIKRLYEECRCTEDIFMDVLKILFPDKTFKNGIIRGYNQDDWQYYIVEEGVDIETLENFYFGKVSDVFVEGMEEDGFCDVITHDELWKVEREDMKEYFRKRYEIAEDEEIRILQADGYIQVPNWKEVC